MQDDQVKYLSIAEFTHNNAIANTIGMSPFFANKGFYPRMSFLSLVEPGPSARERTQAAKANNIADKMASVLEYIREQAALSRKHMTDQANRHRSEVSYEVGDMVFLSSRNIITARPSKKLDDKMLGPFKIAAKIGYSYHLELLASMRIHNVFYLSLLRKAATDPLPGQRVAPPGPIVVNEEEEQELDDILDARQTGRNRRLQFRVRWKNEERPNRQWYNADGNEFGNAADLVTDFYQRYPNKPGNPNRQ